MMLTSGTEGLSGQTIPIGTGEPNLLRLVLSRVSPRSSLLLPLSLSPSVSLHKLCFNLTSTVRKDLLP